MYHANRHYSLKDNKKKNTCFIYLHGLFMYFLCIIIYVFIYMGVPIYMGQPCVLNVLLC
jgi:hypothetical protein